MTFSLDTLFRIFDDTTGDYLEIGPDADGLDLVELRSYSLNPNTGKFDIGDRVTVHPNSIDLLIQALSHFKKV